MREKRHTATQPHKAACTCLRTTHRMEGWEVGPGGAAWGVTGAERGARPATSYDGSSYTTKTEGDGHEYRPRRCTDRPARSGFSGARCTADRSHRASPGHSQRNCREGGGSGPRRTAVASRNSGRSLPRTRSGSAGISARRVTCAQSANRRRVVLRIDHLLPCSRGRRGGQLGPDVLPIVGAKVAAGDFALRDPLNAGAVLHRHGPALDPSSDGRLNNPKLRR